MTTDMPITSIDVNQTLILGAYLEERKKWEQIIIQTEKEILFKREELIFASEQSAKESKIKKFVYGLFKKKTPLREKAEKLAKEVEHLENKYQVILVNEPNANLYEVAMFGNLFKPR